MTSWKSDHAQPFGLLITSTWFPGLLAEKKIIIDDIQTMVVTPCLVLSVRETARATAVLRPTEPTGILELANLLVSGLSSNSTQLL